MTHSFAGSAPPKFTAPGGERTYLETTAPRAVAEELLAARFTDEAGHHTIAHFRQIWWTHRSDQGWREREKNEAKKIAYDFLDLCDVIAGGGDSERVEPYKPNPQKVNAVLEALMSLTLVTGEMPQWLPGTEDVPDPQHCIAFTNGILDAEAYCRGDVLLIDPTPLWFANAGCPYAFDVNATCPVWMKYLEEVLPDQESRDLVSEWFGYCLTPDNSFERFAMLVGGPRSGKGTCLSGLCTMLGTDQIAMTSFSQLASRFGRAPLLGKLAAILPDAHIGRNTDSTAALEVIKSITGGDPQPVDRKNRDELPLVQLTARFSIAVNELPMLPDQASALRSRLLLVVFSFSFEGREDENLKSQIALEGSGLANFALEGLLRFRAKRAFTIPERSRAMTEVFGRLVAPMSAFIEDHCELGADFWVEKDVMYKRWQDWCKDEGIEPGTKDQFGQRLVNSKPEVNPARRGSRGQQFRVYDGIKLTI